MNSDKAVNELLNHKDERVRQLANVIQVRNKQNTKVFKEVTSILEQLRLDIRYIIFDRDCLRRENEELKNS